MVSCTAPPSIQCFLPVLAATAVAGTALVKGRYQLRSADSLKEKWISVKSSNLYQQTAPGSFMRLNDFHKNDLRCRQYCYLV